MKALLCLLAILPSLPALAAPKQSREALEERIGKACLVQLEEEYANSLSICRCVSANLSRGLDLSDLELITRSHELDPEAEKELQKKKHSALILFDFDVTESCLENPGWVTERKP